MADVFPSVREVLGAGPGAVRRARGWSPARTRWTGRCAGCTSAEVPDIATLLRGGELVLTTGIGLPGDDDGLRAFIAELADVGAPGLVVELGRALRRDACPQVMVAAAERLGLPLIELRQADPVRPDHRGRARADRRRPAGRAARHRGDPPAVHRAVRRGRRGGRGGRAGGRAGRCAGRAGEPVPAGARLRRRRRAAELLLDGWESHSRRIRVGRAAPATTRTPAGWSPWSARAARTGAGCCCAGRRAARRAASRRRPG